MGSGNTQTDGKLDAINKLKKHKKGSEK